MKSRKLAIPVFAVVLLFAGLFATCANGQQQGSRGDYGRDNDNWQSAPQEYNTVQRQGFLDGIDGARKDIGNHRNPNVNNRDEYRHPRYKGLDRKAYRDGFQRGYQIAISRLTGNAGNQYQDGRSYNGRGYDDWQSAPQEYSMIQRQGFLDGIDGARKDIGNHRNPNVNNRDEYRHPKYSGQDRRAYRQGFRRGYEMAMSHLMNGGRR
jgi:hypothetical protein